MTSEPLQPFASPTAFPLLDIGSGAVFEWFLYLAFAFWAIYTLVAVYHWFKYSHASIVAIPAVLLHVGVSVVLILYTLSGSIPYFRL